MLRRARVAAPVVGIAFAICAVAAVLPASAAHVHEAGAWCYGISHGLDDGADADYWVYPYNSINGDCYAEQILSLYRAPEAALMHRKTCDRCNWMGFGWDTNPYQECRYYSRHFVRDRLNTHAHSHHYFCG